MRKRFLANARRIGLAVLALLLCASVCMADAPAGQSRLFLKFPVPMTVGGLVGKAFRVRPDLPSFMPLRVSQQNLVIEGSFYPVDKQLAVFESTNFLGVGCARPRLSQFALKQAPVGEVVVLEPEGVVGQVRQVAAGDNHFLAVLADGRVVAWGSNVAGQLGDGTRVDRGTPGPVLGVSNAVAVAACGNQSAILLSCGKVMQVNWLKGIAEEVPGIETAVAVAQGSGHTLALLADGKVMAWGANTYGQLGDGTTTNRTEPVEVKNLAGVAAIAAGQYHSLALRADGTVWAWGANNRSQLGNGYLEKATAPVRVDALPPGIVAINAGRDYSLAVGPDGQVLAWGYNFHGQLGDGTTQTRSLPVFVKDPSGSGALAGVVQVAAGERHSLALLSDGHVVAWGWNYSGQLGDGSFTNRLLPVNVPGLQGVTEIAAGVTATLFRLRDGRLLVAGENDRGQTGQGVLNYHTAPFFVPGVESARSVSVRSWHSLILLNDGRVLACGDSSSGEAGTGSEAQAYAAPVPVQGITNAVAVGTGLRHSVALLGDGRVMCWGSDLSGELGNGYQPLGPKESRVPVFATGISNATKIAVGGDHTLALLSDGRVMAWGSNLGGEIGNGADIAPPKLPFEPSPVEVPLGDVVDIDAWGNTSFALRSDGSVWRWGANRDRVPARLPASGIVRLWKGGFAQAADGRVFDCRYPNSTPVEQPQLMGARYAARGDSSCVACLADGRFVAWGNNDVGQLGNGTTQSSSEPVAVQAPAAPLQVSGSLGWLAVMPDGRVMGWGANPRGCLGHPLSGPQGTPGEVRGLQQ